jgi:hypothetical protein
MSIAAGKGARKDEEDMKIEAALTYDKIGHDHAKAAHLVVSLSAPVATTYATDVVLDLTALAGHQIVSVVSDVEAEAEGGEVAIKIPQILAGERCDLVFAVKLKAQKRAFPRPMNVFGCRLAYEVVSPRGRTERMTIEANAKALFVNPGEESPTPNGALHKIVALAEVLRAKMDGQGKLTKGDLRRKMLLDLRDALERGDDQRALSFAGQLVGLGDGGTSG